MKLYQATLFSLVLFTSFAQADVETANGLPLGLRALKSLE